MRASISAVLCALVACVALSARGLYAQTGPASDIPWEIGPAVGSLGPQSRVRVSDSCSFTGVQGTKQFLTLTQNPTNGSERGTALCTIVRADGDSSYWFAVFEYDPAGYVKDDEKESLDADAILASLRKGNEAGNRVRRERGWETLELKGWERPPFYDPQTNNLTWATRVLEASGTEGINHSVRLLGREGVMKVDLVVAPSDYEASLEQFSRLIASHEFNAGFKYAEWREGDKVASYGLTALVAGGAGAIAAKTGLLGKLWKLLVGLAVGAVAAIRKVFSRRSDK